ncbi:MSHA biogenesis protein MshP [Aeromonas encheleia]|nr:MSHA biogenesis protein MshP [Aeromonas encheleia]VEG94840.1 MSHA biogenesis protein MshP [Aeromonas encheleia]
MSPSAFPPAMTAQRGSAIMIALFVIVIMALLAAAMGRFLVDSGEKNTVEVRGVRALMAAQSGLEIALYRLYPNDHWTAQRCDALTRTAFPIPGLVDCQVSVTCQPITASTNGMTKTSYRFRSEGRCGNADPNSPSPDFAVSRTLVAEAFDGVNP